MARYPRTFMIRTKLRTLRAELVRLFTDYKYSWLNRQGLYALVEQQYDEWERYGRYDWIDTNDPEDPHPRQIYRDAGPRPTPFGVWLACRVDLLWSGYIARTFVWIPCWALGHKVVDDSFGGPDSGYISGHCKRCGWSYHTDLY